MTRVRVTSSLHGVEGTVLYEALDEHGAPVAGTRAAVVGLIHGNEPVGGATVARLRADVERYLTAGSLLLVRANLRAVEQDRRYTEGGRDLNRLFDAASLERLADAAERRCYEETRAVELAPLLLECDAILDLHSTSRPAPPFILFRDDQRHATIAAKLGVLRLVTGLHEAAILDGGLSCNVGLRPGERNPRLGFTFEAGEHTNPDNATRAHAVAVRFLRALDIWSEPIEPSDGRTRVYEVIDRFCQVSNGEPWRFVGYTGGEAGGGRHGPARDLASFETVEADEIIVRRGSSGVVRAQTPFTMLMPAPTAEAGADLYYVAQRRHGGLGVAKSPRTDTEARREAMAIERMLDLIDADEREMGITRASFDSRLVFDQCADLITRAMRLPSADPHRCITVVGRGDWGGDETERRAGQRYRQAFRDALASGLPVDRIQLMRGASLAWLDALTSSAMRKRLAGRESGRAEDVRFWVSAQQPHTVSILVVGDLELAIREADTRHVRVGVVVEAATVEPDGDRAAVRTVRAGLFSSRMEFLRATARLLATLKGEHRRLMRHPALQAAEFQQLLGPEGGICASVEPGALEAMRSGLRELQMGLWRKQLAPLTQGDVVQLGDLDAVGRWVVETMSATGIRDVDAVRSLVVPRGDGFCFDPARALRAMNDPASLVRAGSLRRPAPPQPLAADLIGADDLERWVGWKRYLRGAQPVPDTRGKDIDLAFTGADIHRRIQATFERTQQLAAQMPGRVLVVVAGDGQSPTRDRPSGRGAEVLLAHRRVLLDPRIRYMRIQHAQGTHLSWMKDQLDMLRSRPDSSEPVGLMWEAEHGSSVNVLLVAVRDPEAGPPDPWSLEGWSIEHCGIVMSELEGGSQDYQFAVFTEMLPGIEGRINADLLHFGRSHCEGLLAQAGPRAHGSEVAAFESAVIDQLAIWLRTLRACVDDPEQSVPGPGTERSRWVAETLGLADHRLARALGLQLDAPGAPNEAAAAIWAAVPMWPGPLWAQLQESPS